MPTIRGRSSRVERQTAEVEQAERVVNAPSPASGSLRNAKQSGNHAPVLFGETDRLATVIIPATWMVSVR